MSKRRGWETDDEDLQEPEDAPFPNRREKSELLVRWNKVLAEKRRIYQANRNMTPVPTWQECIETVFPRLVEEKRELARQKYSGDKLEKALNYIDQTEHEYDVMFEATRYGKEFGTIFKPWRVVMKRPTFRSEDLDPLWARAMTLRNSRQEDKSLRKEYTPEEFAGAAAAFAGPPLGPTTWVPLSTTSNTGFQPAPVTKGRGAGFLRSASDWPAPGAVPPPRGPPGFPSQPQHTQRFVTSTSKIGALTDSTTQPRPPSTGSTIHAALHPTDHSARRHRTPSRRRRSRSRGGSRRHSPARSPSRKKRSHSRHRTPSRRRDSSRRDEDRRHHEGPSSRRRTPSRERRNRSRERDSTPPRRMKLPTPPPPRTAVEKDTRAGGDNLARGSSSPPRLRSDRKGTQPNSPTPSHASKASQHDDLDDERLNKPLGEFLADLDPKAPEKPESKPPEKPPPREEEPLIPERPVPPTFSAVMAACLFELKKNTNVPPRSHHVFAWGNTPDDTRIAKKNCRRFYAYVQALERADVLSNMWEPRSPPEVDWGRHALKVCREMFAGPSTAFGAMDTRVPELTQILSYARQINFLSTMEPLASSRAPLLRYQKAWERWGVKFSLNEELLATFETRAQKLAREKVAAERQQQGELQQCRSKIAELERTMLQLRAQNPPSTPPAPPASEAASRGKEDSPPLSPQQVTGSQQTESLPPTPRSNPPMSPTPMDEEATSVAEPTTTAGDVVGATASSPPRTDSEQSVPTAQESQTDIPVATGSSEDNLEQLIANFKLVVKTEGERQWNLLRDIPDAIPEYAKELQGFVGDLKGERAAHNAIKLDAQFQMIKEARKGGAFWEMPRSLPLVGTGKSPLLLDFTKGANTKEHFLVLAQLMLTMKMRSIANEEPGVPKVLKALVEVLPRSIMPSVLSMKTLQISKLKLPPRDKEIISNMLGSGWQVPRAPPPTPPSSARRKQPPAEQGERTEEPTGNAGGKSSPAPPPSPEAQGAAGGDSESDSDSSDTSSSSSSDSSEPPLSPAHSRRNKGSRQKGGARKKKKLH